MKHPSNTIDIYLQPGELWFGDEDTCIRTILGSCVAITLWHPHLRVGGMCHFMLPGRRRQPRQAALDGRYGDDAMALLLEEIRKVGGHPREYRLKMFGGGNMFPETAHDNARHVGADNVLAARELAKQHGFECVAEHLGGFGHRHLVFSVRNGNVSLRHCALHAAGSAKLQVTPVSLPFGCVPDAKRAVTGAEVMAVKKAG